MNKKQQEKVDGRTFEHNEFKCKIIERPDLCYVYRVYGYRKSDNKVFYPSLCFDKDLSFEQIRDASIAIIDGTFTGKVEVYGSLIIWAGQKGD